MTNLNDGKKDFSRNIVMKRMLCLLLSVALIADWCPSAFATAETIGPAGSPATSDAIGSLDGYFINNGGAAYTLNVTAGFPDIFTSNLGGPFTNSAVTTNNAGLSNIVFSSNSNVYGTIGTGASFADLTLTGATSVNFFGTVNTAMMHVATGTADFKSGTNNNNAAITFTGDGIVILDSNTTVIGAIGNQVAQQGTLTLNSASVLSGAVGGATGLKDINIVGSGVSATISGAVNTYQIDLLNNTLNVGGALTVAPNGVINTTVNGAGDFGKVVTTGAVTIGSGTVINETLNNGAIIIAATSIVTNYTAPITIAVTIAGGAVVTPTGSATTGSLSGSGEIALGAGVILTTGTLNTNDSYTGVISGAGGLTKVGTGTLTLSGADTYTGNTMIDGGTLKINSSTGSLAAASTLTFTGTGTFNYDNTGASGARSQNLGALTFSTSGDGTVQSTRAAAQNVTLTFASLAARQVGGTENFVVSGGTNGTNNSIVLTGTADKAFLGNGIFFGGSKYATVEGAGGYVRAYGAGDTNYLAAPTAATIGASVNTDNVDLTTGNITAQTTIAANTIDMGSNNITMFAADQILSTNGLLSNGSAVATLGSTGGILQATAAGNEIVVRVNGSTDVLNIGSIIQNNAGGAVASALTKSGEGKLTFSGLNTYTGVTYLNAGTVNLGVAETVNVSGPLGKQLANAAGTIVLNGGMLQYSGLNQNDYSGRFSTVDYQQYNVDTNSQSVTWATALTSSGGSLTKAGTGALTLSGANTYTGATTVSAGTLKLGNATALGTTETGTSVSAGNVAALDLNGQTVGAEAVTLNGTGVGGAGALLNSNAAAASLSGLITLATSSTITSTGAGGLTLSGGIAKNGVTLTLNGGTGAGAITVSGAITGASAGSDLIVDNVTVNLNAANTYVGPTTIRSTGTAGLGILNANVAGALPTGTRTVLTMDDAGLGGSSLVLGASQSIASLTGIGGAASSLVNLGVNTLTIGTTAGTTTFAGVISGAGGSLTKDGVSTQILSGLNTYTGATTVSAGTLQAGVATQAFGVGSAVTVASGATLNLGGNSETIGSLAGAGTVRGGGVATLTAGGDNTSTTFSGLIQDGGGATGFTKTGTGTLTISGVNTNTGVTSVGAGTLALNGATAFGGNFNLGVGTGVLTLGANTLTLTGAGAYSQAAGQTLNLTINNASTFGKIVAAGTANGINGGALAVTVGSGYIQGGTTFTVIQSGAGAVAAVPTITDSSYVLSFTGAASGSNLDLTANRINAYDTLSTNNSNDNAVGTALEQAGKNGATGDMATVLGTLDGLGSAQQITNALETMTPDVSSGALTASRAMAGNSFRMVGNRLGGARNVSEGSGVSSGDMTHGVGVWVQGLGSNTKQDERGGIQGFSANTWGTMIGADKVIDDHFRAGLAGGYGRAGVNSKTPGSPSDTINSYQATIYGSYDSLNLNKAPQGGKKSPEAVRNQRENSWYMDGMLSFAENDYDSRREIWLTPTSGRVAKADHSGQQYSTNFEGGYTFTSRETKALELTPFASIGYNYLRMNSYKEKGADALDLSVQGDGFHQLEQSLGTKFAYPIVAKKVGRFIPSAKAAWLYDYIGDRFETNASFAGGGSSFTTQGAKPAKNGVLFGAELAFLSKGNVTVTGNWDITFKDQAMSNNYYGTVRYDF